VYELSLSRLLSAEDDSPALLLQLLLLTLLRPRPGDGNCSRSFMGTPTEVPSVTWASALPEDWDRIAVGVSEDAELILNGRVAPASSSVPLSLRRMTSLMGRCDPLALAWCRPLP
jgi:hypothetical protein